MNENETRLFVSFEARLNDLEKGMKKADAIARAAYGGMKRESRSATKQMEQDAIRSTNRINQAMATMSTKVGTYSKAFAGGLIGGLTAGGVAGVAASIAKVAESFSNIGREAKQAGLATKEFQQWKYVAEQARIPLDAMIDGFKELNLRADEYVQTGKGSAAEAFQRLGMSPAEVKERLKNPSELMLELIERTRSLKDTASGIRIFDELLGGSGGEKFVQLIDQGRDGISKTITEAETLGMVFSQDVIDKATEADKLFHKWSQTISVNVKGALVDAFNALNAFLGSWQDFEDRTASQLTSQKGILEARKVQLEGQKGSTEDTILGWIGKDAATELAAVDVELGKINEALEYQAKIKPPTTVETTDRPFTPYVPPETKPGKGKTSTRDKEAAAIEREQKAVAELIVQLEHELSLIGMSDQQRRAAEASRKAGTTATEEQRQKIVALTEAIYQEQEAKEKAKQAQEAWAETLTAGYEMVGDTILSIVDGSEKASDAVKRLGVELALAVAQASLLGTGPMAGLFSGGGLGSLLGGGTQMSKVLGGGLTGMFANGTDFAPGGRALVGERGPEIVNLPRGSQVIPNHKIDGTGGTVNRSDNVNIKIDVRGAQGNSEIQQMVNQGVAAGLKQYDKGSAVRAARDMRQVSNRGYAR